MLINTISEIILAVWKLDKFVNSENLGKYNFCISKIKLVGLRESRVNNPILIPLSTHPRTNV